MSVEELMAAVPDAHPVKSESRIKTPAGWADELMQVDGIGLVNAKFHARLYFLAGHLQQVTLTPDGLTGYAADLTYQQLITALRSKYGAEASSKSDPSQIMTMKSADWIHDRTNISLILIYSGINDPHPVLNVNYQVRIAQDADKL